MASALDAATVADMRIMQSDVYSPYAARIVAALKRLSFTDPKATRAVAVLARWDARAERTGPSRLFYAFMKSIRRDAGSLRVTWSMLERMIDGSGAQSYWDDPETPQVETRQGRIEAALAHTLDAVERDEGKDPRRWSFGAGHRLVYEHPFASALPPSIAKRLAIGPVALPGEWHTLDVAGFSLRGDRYDVTHIPSARLIVDLGDPDASRLVLPLGQSGQLFDRHGKDQLRAWSIGHDFPLPFTPKAVAAATLSTLTFVPAD
jgi:penicillin amidase